MKMGQKMSKSKGNVIDPLRINYMKYGADSFKVYPLISMASPRKRCKTYQRIELTGYRNFITINYGVQIIF